MRNIWNCHWNTPDHMKHFVIVQTIYPFIYTSQFNHLLSENETNQQHILRSFSVQWFCFLHNYVVNWFLTHSCLRINFWLFHEHLLHLTFTPSIPNQNFTTFVIFKIAKYVVKPQNLTFMLFALFKTTNVPF